MKRKKLRTKVEPKDQCQRFSGQPSMLCVDLARAYKQIPLEEEFAWLHKEQ